MLSAQYVQDRFPDINVDSSGDELHEENEEVSVICIRANMLRIVIILCHKMKEEPVIETKERKATQEKKSCIC